MEIGCRVAVVTRVGAGILCHSRARLNISSRLGALRYGKWHNAGQAWLRFASTAGEVPTRCANMVPHVRVALAAHVLTPGACDP
eukprot:SAG22_NODE_17701_length_300_cov_0.761194_1_plen_83_part_01